MALLKPADFTIELLGTEREQFVWKVILTLLVIVLSVMGRSIASGGEASTTKAAGHRVEGFVLSLQSEGLQSRLGSPIWVTVELRNLTGKDQKGMDFNSLYSGYDFAIRNLKTGQLVPRNKHTLFGTQGGSMSTTWDVAPGNSLYGRFRLDLLYNFTAPGTYLVQVISGHPVIHNRIVTMQSNKITIAVLP
jgi:hypothetical protein